LAGRFDIEPDDDWVPRYNIAPAQNVPVIRLHAEEPKRFGSKMRWWLIPYWAKDASIAYKMINARAETEATNPPSVRRYFFRRRLALALALLSQGAISEVIDARPLLEISLKPDNIAAWDFSLTMRRYSA
jgi:hypothetical protein